MADGEENVDSMETGLLSFFTNAITRNTLIDDGFKHVEVHVPESFGNDV